MNVATAADRTDAEPDTEITISPEELQAHMEQIARRFFHRAATDALAMIDRGELRSADRPAAADELLTLRALLQLSKRP